MWKSIYRKSNIYFVFFFFDSMSYDEFVECYFERKMLFGSRCFEFRWKLLSWFCLYHKTPVSNRFVWIISKHHHWNIKQMLWSFFILSSFNMHECNFKMYLTSILWYCGTKYLKSEKKTRLKAHWTYCKQQQGELWTKKKLGCCCAYTQCIFSKCINKTSTAKINNNKT